MGYETKLYVVSWSSLDESKFAEIDGKWREVFGCYRNDPHAYAEDGNTRVDVPNNAELISRKYSSVVATVDLCKTGYDSHISNLEKKDSECYFYADDGNTPVIVDHYDETLRQADIEDVIEALEKDLEDSDYRRFKIALALLKSCNESFDNVKVLFFGH